MHEMAWYGNNKDIDNEADIETELGTMLTNIKGLEDEFKEILQSYGIITMKIILTFIRRPSYIANRIHAGRIKIQNIQSKPCEDT